MLDIALLAILAAPFAAGALPGDIANGDLEEGRLGEPPQGWWFPQPCIEAGYRCRLTQMGTHQGERCAEIAREGERRAEGFGNLVQAIDAGAYRGKRIRMRAAVRATGRAQLWLDRASDEDITAALGQLAAARGVVFDLRGYPKGSTLAISHLIDRPVTCAQWHVPTLVRPESSVAYDFGNWPVMPATPRLSGRIAFLTGPGAISYAETYLGIIEHYRLAEIVGGPTAGTNGNVNMIDLPGGYRISFTGMKVLKHDGSIHHGHGILPTVPVARTIAGVAAGRDEVLEKGIEVVSRP